MIIRNFQSLSTSSAKKDALKILEVGLVAASPLQYLTQIVKNDHLVISGRRINLKKYAHVFVVSVGKASYEMARTIASLTHIDGGIVVIPDGTKKMGPKFKVIQAGHPIPNKNSITAANAILKFLHSTTQKDIVLFLISGGSSSLVALPDGMTLEEKQRTTHLLLRCGASIQEVNCVRKHLSKIKGGKILGNLRSDAVSLVMSDVIGDDLSSIASGMTYYDQTTFLDAKNILKKYRISKLVPPNVLGHIDLGIKGRIPETPKSKKIPNYIIATNKNCLDAMKSHAQDLGYPVRVVKNISGNVDLLATKLSKMFLDAKTNCLIFGGESTVVVKGNGKGGRNQELVLRISSNLFEKGKNAVVASVGTDGIDGSTDCAGAIWESDQKMNDAKSYLGKNDSYNFFKKSGGLIFTGYTGTNLLDVGVILRK